MMGGERCKTELISYDEFKANVDVWEILQKGGVTPFMERLHGFKTSISKEFVDA